MENILYKAGNAQMSDMLSGRVPVAFVPAATVATAVKSGKLRLLAVTGSGRVKEALPAYEKAIGWGDNTAAPMCFYGYALARAGRQEEALRILHQVEKSTDFVPPSAIAVTYVGLGDNERAMQLLQRAFEIRDPIIQYIKVESHYDPLKNDPRFQELIQKLGLPR